MQNKINIKNSFVNKLPGDADLSNKPRQVYNSCFSYVNPKKPKKPELVLYSKETGEIIGLNENDCRSKDFLEIFSGKKNLKNAKPFAMNYGGHQFGSWAGQLGDGRAINIGEINSNNQKYFLQLKGAGPTPYSRSGDGYAVLRSSVREFLCSEAMHYLGIPTTRALSLVLTGSSVLRDMLYDGNPKYEPGAIVTRVSSTFIRFGSFEIFAARQEYEILKQLADYTIENDFPDIKSSGKEKYLEFFSRVLNLTADLIVNWMRVGFVHGVMNTDNMSVNGLTIDYGPYGWLEVYDPGWTPNTTDAQFKRYAFGNQPEIAFWNLSMFANALYPLINEAKPLELELNKFQSLFNSKYLEMMSSKLGIDDFKKNETKNLINELNKVLTIVETDMTIFFRKLSDLDPWKDSEMNFQILKEAFYNISEFTIDKKKIFLSWIEKYLEILKKENKPPHIRKKEMDVVNPFYVLRNYLAHESAQRAEKGEYNYLNDLFNTLKRPYKEQPGKEKFAEKMPEWARHKPGCSMLSCSS
ncbi:MAG: YdiU family protein [Desulforegulaceae bacterium]|nr:YdiU family protein [Desulforegulaceae bacterium]